VLVGEIGTSLNDQVRMLEKSTKSIRKTIQQQQ
jgi:hypothetical protein